MVTKSNTITQTQSLWPLVMIVQIVNNRALRSAVAAGEWPSQQITCHGRGTFDYLIHPSLVYPFNWHIKRPTSTKKLFHQSTELHGIFIHHTDLCWRSTCLLFSLIATMRHVEAYVPPVTFLTHVDTFCQKYPR